MKTKISFKGEGAKNPLGERNNSNTKFKQNPPPYLSFS